MKRLFVVIIIALLVASCTAQQNDFLSGESPIGSNTNSQTELPGQIEETKTITPIQESTPDHVITMDLETVENPVYKFSWGSASDTLFYTSSIDLDKWHIYPNDSSDLDVLDVYPVLSDEVAEKIGFYDLSNPAKYSISPSGHYVLYWKQAHTKPTPTPAEGEVSYPEDEWLFDVYMISADGFSEQYIARFDGWILDAFWSNEEDQVFLKFDQLQIPSEYILIHIDIASGSFKEVIPLGIEDISPWIAISPDDSSIIFQEKKQPGQLILLSLISGEVTRFSGLPPFTVIYWLDSFNWLLASNITEGSLFIIYDFISNQECFRMEFPTRIMNFAGLQNPFCRPQETNWFSLVTTMKILEHWHYISYQLRIRKIRIVKMNADTRVGCSSNFVATQTPCSDST